MEDALLQNDLNISRTAKALNMSRNTLYAVFCI
ncbi:helix-turn-helix domain-containing protein [Emergencia timonensis]